ncbi:uncharacterized protein LOC125168846 isoform X2 [Prionailurus viverrinus]|uniref:uncharacterized protein LOC125168846 isoform X2 n=1 Tax=Prionailurus viverrinus TaxID=61388 RepID=UPI001FF489FA|nr:uncharacterized protein LOC125168846 isoform X2 [Prionailurus viverrinus]
MVQVYSLSSSSRTVQLYSRSRLLLLPLINLLSIFPPARPPAPGRDAAALRTPDQAPLSRAAPRGPRAPAPSPQPGRGRCLLLSQLLLLLLLLRHRLPPAPSKRPALSPPRPTPHAQFVGRGLGRRGANGGQRGGTEWQREEPIEKTKETESMSGDVTYPDVLGY